MKTIKFTVTAKHIKSGLEAYKNKTKSPPVIWAWSCRCPASISLKEKTGATNVSVMPWHVYINEVRYLPSKNLAKFIRQVDQSLQRGGNKKIKAATFIIKKAL